MVNVTSVIGQVVHTHVVIVPGHQSGMDHHEPIHHSAASDDVVGQSCDLGHMHMLASGCLTYVTHSRAAGAGSVHNIHWKASHKIKHTTKPCCWLHTGIVHMYIHTCM